jgi:hypothetical protein|tara:strand:+ start:981 stop:1154 length:174 start_codon:yes stop_codon:yes gene_type:complete
MSLPIEQLQRIMVDEILEKTPTIINKEANAFAKSIQDDIAFAKANKIILEIPPEWEV